MTQCNDTSSEGFIAAVTEMIEGFLVDVHRNRHYEPGTFRARPLLLAFLEGVYSAQDTARLIAYEMIKFVSAKGDIITALPGILSFEDTLFKRLQSD